MGQFDQTARQGCKVDGAAFFDWVFGRLVPEPALLFERWDDTRRLVSPGEPDRTNDLVAWLRSRSQPDLQVCVIVEAEEEPERAILYRLGQYELTLGREVAPDGEGAGEPMVRSVLLNLTGRQRPARLQWDIPGLGEGSRVVPEIINLQEEDAAGTLASIVSGRFGLAILLWIPLMKGGGMPALIQQWKEIAGREPDVLRRALYRDLALVFAELTREQVNWLRALEDWEMRESTYIKKFEMRGEERGELRAKRGALLQAVRVRLQDPVPEPIRLAIEGTNDPAVLDRWFTVALAAGTVAELRTAMKLEP